MKQNVMDNNDKTKILIHKVFFFALTLEGLIVFLILAFHPSAAEGRVFWLYSAPRFMELIITMMITIFATRSIINLANPVWRDKLTELVSSSLWNDRLFYGGIFVLAISRLLIIILQVFAEGIDLRHLTTYVIHLQPISFLFSLIGLELVLWAFFIKKGSLLHVLGAEKRYFSIAGTIWSLLSIISIFSVFFNTQQETGTPTSPLLEWQIFLAWVLATIAIMAFQHQDVTPSEEQISQYKQTFIIALLVAMAAFLFHVSLQSMMRPYAIDNFYFQEWSSEKMMQTVSLRYLKNSPLETLNNIHTKPPGFDAIRAVFVHLWPAQDINTSLLHVDFLLYKLWTLLYSIMGGLAFLWISNLAGRKVAVIASFILLLHPASIQYSTLLDSNFLTVFLVFSFYYLLWKLKNKNNLPITIVIVMVLALFLTRAIFQLPFTIVTGLSLFLFGVQKRKFFIFLLVTGTIIVVYGVKQYYQFGILSTTSFTGLNLNRSVGNRNFTDYWTLDIDFREQDEKLPETLIRPRKVGGSINYNHIQYLEYNQELIEDYKKFMLATPVSQIIKSYWENIQIYFRPSTVYHTKHAIVDRIPWKDFYDHIFSSPILPTLLLLLGTWWIIKVIKRKDYLPSIGLILPGLYIFLITILFEKGENMRFKFFIEPVLFVFIISQLYDISQELHKKIRHRTN